MAYAVKTTAGKTCVESQVLHKTDIYGVLGDTVIKGAHRTIFFLCDRV